MTGTSAGPVVRLGRSADLTEASAVFRRASLSNAGDRDNLLAHPEYLVLGPEGLAEGRTLVAEQDDVVVGFATWAETADAMELEDLFVDPDHRRRGIAMALVGRIAHQAERARAGKPARIQFKCNAIIDEVIVDALYRASQAGVPIDLWIRGISAIKPGVPGLSETIRVRSVLGRFLEHSRVYSFGTGEHDENDPEAVGEVWLGSPDLMHRNLDRRVETVVRVGDTGHRRELRRLLELGMDDGTSSWWQDAEGTWTRHSTGPDGERLRDIQLMLIRDRRPRPGEARTADA